jgi:SAM-dependent methyltransferase
MTTREFFLTSYDGEPPPWDIGKPQPDLVRAFDEVALSGSVIDLGCGTGEHVLELARRGLDAWGVDATPKAIAFAEKKRDERGLTARFVLGDALDLAPLARTFDTVLDCGLFHVIAEEERQRYVKELSHVLPVGGRFLMMGFQTNESGRGPRGYSLEELRGYYKAGFREVFIRPGKFEKVGGEEGSPAWVSLFVRA